ncbi:MAG: hypothetical protein GWN79_11480, partial [Actinobacteria bacterium]|nr:hypothetical protein [Actinomycetota bacterium]NIS31970.1 hypothetical protein [Actinomycetota bacterium]NIU19668.1 hypothetical protein [Actinomycetota bacterium]NIU67053.1 hypothetical protein [Actinomycetota bacterium]NIV56148.1 hypothetical protein [Actinomycetota bacterium]
MRKLALAALIMMMTGTPAHADERPRSFTIAASGDILIHGMVMDAARA